MTPTDPRGREDGLGWVSRAVFADEGLRLTIGPARSPGVGPVVARYAVVPSVERARFLLPLGNRRVAAAAMLAYNGLRPRKVRAARAIVGGAARLGALAAAPFPVLTVAGEGRTLAGRVADSLGHGPLYAAIGVRPPDPNRKPTLQLFDSAGAPRGYAKIGWNDATRDLVRTEAAALRDMPSGGGHPLAPGLLDAFEWEGYAVVVVAPLPADVRRVDRGGAAPEIDAILAVARRGGAARPVRPLAATPFRSRLRSCAAAAAETFGEPGRRAVRLVEALMARHGDVPVESGDWHGDWVPWNLGASRGRLVAWDWEHRGSGVPLGFDLAHQGFQEALVLGGRPAAVAAVAADDLVARFGGALGLSTRQRAAVVDAYLAEMWLRTARLAAGGAGWNPALHPGLLDVLDNRFGGLSP